MCATCVRQPVRIRRLAVSRTAIDTALAGRDVERCTTISHGRKFSREQRGVASNPSFRRVLDNGSTWDLSWGRCLARRRNPRQYRYHCRPFPCPIPADRPTGLWWGHLNCRDLQEAAHQALSSRPGFAGVAGLTIPQPARATVAATPMASKHAVLAVPWVWEAAAGQGAVAPVGRRTSQARSAQPVNAAMACGRTRRPAARADEIPACRSSPEYAL